MRRGRFELGETPVSVTACHCVRCRKQPGHYFAAGNVAKSAVQLSGAEHITWYQSSENVRRGFCARCGAWLFWEPLHNAWTSVALGSIDGATGLQLERHVFVAENGDYYALGDGLPQNTHQRAGARWASPDVSSGTRELRGCVRDPDWARGAQPMPVGIGEHSSPSWPRGRRASPRSPDGPKWLR